MSILISIYLLIMKSKRGRPKGRKTRAITITINGGLWKKARLWAFNRNMSLSALVGIGLGMAMGNRAGDSGAERSAS